MPYPIRKTKDQMQENVKAQDYSNLTPFLQQPMSLLQDILLGDSDKESIRSIWLKSEARDDKIVKVSSSVSSKEIDMLVSKGFVEYIDKDNKIIAFTERGSKILKESILNNENTSFSFTKKASNELLLKNVYDFGEEVLVRINHPEKFGTRYVTMHKSKIANKGIPKKIVDYNIATKKDDGSYKELPDYSDEELIKVLHLAKRIISNHQEIRTANKSISSLPINRIKSFAEVIMRELDKR